MAKDFRASQIQTTQVISSGSSGTNANIVFYDIARQSDTSPNQGVINPDKFNTGSIGEDIFLYVSGTKTSGSSDDEITVFGGSVRVSGNLVVGTGSLTLEEDKLRFDGGNTKVEKDGGDLKLFDTNNSSGKTLTELASTSNESLQDAYLAGPIIDVNSSTGSVAISGSISEPNLKLASANAVEDMFSMVAEGKETFKMKNGTEFGRAEIIFKSEGDNSGKIIWTDRDDLGGRQANIQYHENSDTLFINGGDVDTAKSHVTINETGGEGQTLNIYNQGTFDPYPAGIAAFFQNSDDPGGILEVSGVFALATNIGRFRKGFVADDDPNAELINYGNDVFTFVSGGIGQKDVSGSHAISVFGGDVQVSGTFVEGTDNTTNGSQTSAIIGDSNTLNNTRTTLVAGSSHTADGERDVMLGGISNTISASQFDNTIINGFSNEVNNSQNAGILIGDFNEITNADTSVVLGSRTTISSSTQKDDNFAIGTFHTIGERNLTTLIGYGITAPAEDGVIVIGGDESVNSNFATKLIFSASRNVEIRGNTKSSGTLAQGIDNFITGVNENHPDRFVTSSAIIGGDSNAIEYSDRGVVAGGTLNFITTLSSSTVAHRNNAIVGGFDNAIEALGGSTAQSNVILGGSSNRISESVDSSAILGGDTNEIFTTLESIAIGSDNVITSAFSSDYNYAIGRGNTIQGYPDGLSEHTPHNNVLIGFGLVNPPDTDGTSDALVLIGGDENTFTGGEPTRVAISASRGTLIKEGPLSAFSGISGSLTKLTDGSNFIVGAGGLTTSTSSAGQVTIDATSLSSSIASDINELEQGVFWSSDTADLIFTTGSAEASGSITAKSGFSGSLTRLADGSHYLLAGNNITLTTNSLGQVAISSSAGGGTDADWIDGGGKIRTTSSVAVSSQNEFAGDRGVDVFFFVSGTFGSGSAGDAVSVFGGDVRISGTLAVGTGSTFIKDNSVTLISASVQNEGGLLVFYDDENLSGKSLSQIDAGSGSGDFDWVDDGGKIRTTSSVAVSTEAQFAGSQGQDVYFFVSGATGGKDGTTKNVSLFGGDVHISGNLTVDGSSPGGGSSTSFFFSDTADLIETTGSVEASGSITAKAGFTGSLQKLTDGSDFLVGGTDITTTNNADGSITIDSTASSSSTFFFSNTADVVETTGSVEASGSITAKSGITGSLTTLIDGNNFIVSSNGLSTSTGSNGQVTISGQPLSGNVASDINDLQAKTGTGVHWFSNEADLTENTGSVEVSGSAAVFGGLSGSLTRLADGSNYLLAGDNVTLVTNSVGQIEISSSGGGSTTTLQEAYEAGNTISTNNTAGTIHISGTADPLLSLQHGNNDTLLQISASTGDAVFRIARATEFGNVEMSFKSVGDNHGRILWHSEDVDITGTPEASILYDEGEDTLKVNDGNEGSSQYVAINDTAGDGQSIRISNPSGISAPWQGGIVTFFHNNSAGDGLIAVSGAMSVEGDVAIFRTGVIVDNVDYASLTEYGQDAHFFVSGGIGEKDSSNASISIFGGDVHVSGNLSVDGTAPGGGASFFFSDTADLVETTGSLAVTGSVTTSGTLDSRAGVKFNPAFVTSSVSISTNQYIVAASASSDITLTLPTSVENGRTFVVKDAVGNASSNNIIVSSSAEQIDGSSTYTIAVDYGSAQFVFFSSSVVTSWGVI